jgi:hypothetical protein
LDSHSTSSTFVQIKKKIDANPQPHREAAVWAMEKLDYYPFGRNFTLLTDLQAIKYLLKKKCIEEIRERSHEQMHGG